jgi:hypothetical protein
MSQLAEATRPIAVLLEIETENHNAERCFQGLDPHFTLSVKADEVRDPSNPRLTAERIIQQIPAHRQKASAQGFDAVAVATHQWHAWRDTIGSEVQEPFAELLQSHGVRFIELGTERCNEQFRHLLSEQFACALS